MSGSRLGFMTISESAAHAIPRFAHAVDAALDRVLESSALFMRPEEKVDALVTLARVEARLSALKLRVLAASEDACEAGAHRSVADLASAKTGEDRARCAADVRLAVALERFTIVGAAMAAGVLSPVKARIITRELADLDADPDVSRDLVDLAEQHLVSQATEFAPRELEAIAKKILETIAPWIEDERERQRLEAAEQRAQRRLTLQLITSPGGLEGVTELRARIPTAVAGRLRTYLEAFTAPRHLANTSVSANTRTQTNTEAEAEAGNSLDSAWSTTALGEHVPYHQRLGAAFCSLLEAIDPDRLPLHGGTATSIMITIGLKDLIEGLNAANISAGSHGDLRITAAQARRLACTANLIPAVLGSNSEVLDLGRASRLFTTAQRKAMALRDKHCRTEGCTVPAAWCEAHHYREPWSHGGKTDLNDGKLLCPWHHHRAHDARYLVSEMANGDVRYTRRR